MNNLQTLGEHLNESEDLKYGVAMRYLKNFGKEPWGERKSFGHERDTAGGGQILYSIKAAMVKKAGLDLDDIFMDDPSFDGRAITDARGTVAKLPDGITLAKVGALYIGQVKKAIKKALTKKDESVKFKNIQPLNEFGPMKGSGNRRMTTQDAVDRIGDLEDMLWNGNVRRAEKEWEMVSGEYLTGEEGAKYWADLNDDDLRSAIDDAESIMKKYKMSESVNEAQKYDWDDILDVLMTSTAVGGAGHILDRINAKDPEVKELLQGRYKSFPDFAKAVKSIYNLKESVNEADQMHGEYLMQMLKAQADDIKRDEPKTAAALMYLWDRINQSARDKDIDAEYVHDFLNEPRGRKHSQNIPEWMILDLFVESFLMKEDGATNMPEADPPIPLTPKQRKKKKEDEDEEAEEMAATDAADGAGPPKQGGFGKAAAKQMQDYMESIDNFKSWKESINEGEILVWDEMEKPFEDLKNTLDKIGKENTDPKWSKAILTVWNMIEKAEDKLNLYDKMYGAIPIKESVNEAIKSKGKPIKKGDKFYDTYGDAFTVAKVASNKIELKGDDGVKTFPDDFDNPDFDVWFVKESVKENETYKGI
jgi:hypothetical protein